ncbi:uncharacterized protein LOC132195025 [Neocloeon triangulifer]|uniref:uncharacterized protein LOC132195025 n=1 Tax=Neocloeon triangulifer TaxID=2078957 RepID=UPI00286EF904|nr:uncharacterized protein LOC132195025 [Neocloeon triangulifer]XP_059472696.1 uncharacterized protein LOC132195025 [Neocloeon triangulifer]
MARRKNKNRAAKSGEQQPSNKQKKPFNPWLRGLEGPPKTYSLPTVTSASGVAPSTSRSAEAAELAAEKQRFQPVKNALPYLNEQSQILHGKDLHNLNGNQRADVWNAIKDRRTYGMRFWNEMLLLMDGEFTNGDPNNPVTFKFSPSKLTHFTQIIFSQEYMCLTLTERQLLRSFLVACKGEYNFKSANNTILQEIQKICFDVATKSVQFSRLGGKNSEFDQRLNKITGVEDKSRYKLLLEQQARNDYDLGFECLCPALAKLVKEKVKIEYQVQILQSEGIKPITLDEAAYLLYISPFKKLTPYAQYCATKFRAQFILKMWQHLKVHHYSKEPLFPSDPISLAFCFLTGGNLHYLCNPGMNFYMLADQEKLTIAKFAKDYPRRYKKLTDLQASEALEENRLNSLLEDEEDVVSKDASVGLQMLPLHIKQAFMSDTTIFQNIKEKKEPAPETVTISEPPPSTSTGYENYVQILDLENVVESAPEVSDEPVVPNEVATEPKTRQSVWFAPDKSSKSVIHMIISNRIATLKAIMEKAECHLWTKFVILKTSKVLGKEELLFTLVDSLSTTFCKFLIYKFHIDEDDCVFYSTDCTLVIEIFMRRNLKINTSKGVFDMHIEVGCDEFKLDKLDKSYFVRSFLMNVLGQRLQEDATHLNLSQFHKTEELEKELLFFPLRLQWNFEKICTCLSSLVCKSLVSLDLSNNRIASFSSSKVEVAKYVEAFGKVHTLDLRNNQLHMSSLFNLAFMPLRNVYLDGNPLCSFYDNEKEYIMDILKIWPNLEFLDGRRIISSNAPSSKPHYFPMPEAQDFTRQFLTHFFSLFDSERRDLLQGLYHSKALLSMTSTFLDDQTTSDNANLSSFLLQSRNIKRISDMSKSEKLIHEGCKPIIEFCQSLPATEHDSSSFNVDIINYNERNVHFCVSGVFKEKDNPETSPRFFRRIFHLVNFSSFFLIVNELLYICNCTTAQANTLCKSVEEAPVLDLYLSSIPRLTVFTDEQKLGLMKKLSDVTGMNVRWSKKCLDDMKWDLRNALIYFQQYYNQELIPSDAFL